MGVAILASAFFVLELGALVIYDGIKKFSNSCSEWGEVAGRGESGHLTKLSLKILILHIF